MTWKEHVWRIILVENRSLRKAHWQQKELAKMLGISVSTVHEALQVPRRAGAIVVGGRGFELVDRRKLLLIWAVFRNLPKDTLWYARIRLPVGDVEGEMIPEASFTGPSGFKFLYGYAPADYDEVTVYLAREHLPKIQGRFKNYENKRAGETKLRVLVKDSALPEEIPPELMYVDVWQMHPWWTAEFLRALEERMDEQRGLSF